MPTQSLVRLLIATSVFLTVAACDHPTPVQPVPDPAPVTTAPAVPLPDPPVAQPPSNPPVVGPDPTPAPSIACPADVLADADASPWPVVYAAPVVSGGLSPITTTCTPPSNSSFPSGASTVTCTATDALVRQAQCAFKITVNVIRLLQGTKFLAFGDSITSGEVAPTLSVKDAHPELSYPTKLQAMLTARYKKQTVSVKNEGQYGRAAACGVGSLPGCDAANASEQELVDALDANRPDALLLMLGTNDAHDDISPALVATGLKNDIARAKQRPFVKIVYLATIPPFGACSPGVFCRAADPADVDAVNDVIRSVASSQGAVLVDVFAAINPNKALLIGNDGLHPTELGNQVIADTFLKAIQSTFEQPLPGSSLSRAQPPLLLSR